MKEATVNELRELLKAYNFFLQKDNKNKRFEGWMTYPEFLSEVGSASGKATDTEQNLRDAISVIRIAIGSGTPPSDTTPSELEELVVRAEAAREQYEQVRERESGQIDRWIHNLRKVPLTPAQVIPSIHLDKTEVEGVVENVLNASTNPTLYTNNVIVDIEKSFKEDPDIKGVLDEKQIHLQALKIAPFTTEKFLEVNEQVKELSREGMRKRVSEFIQPVHLISVLRPFDNPSSPLLRGLNGKDKEEFAEKMRTIEIMAAVEDDLTRKYWNKTFGANISNALLGNPEVEYVQSENEKDKQRVQVDLKQIYDLYSQFFGREISVTSEALDVIPTGIYKWYNPMTISSGSVGSAVVPVESATIGVYVGWQTTSALMAYYGAHALAMPALPMLGVGLSALPVGIGATEVGSEIASLTGVPYTITSATGEIVGSGFGTIVGLGGETAATATAVGGTELATTATGTAIAAGTEAATATAIAASAVAIPVIGAAVGVVAGWVVTKVLPWIRRNIEPILGTILAGFGGLVGLVVAGPIGLMVGVGSGLAIAGGVAGGSLSAGVASVAGAFGPIGGAFVSAIAGPFIVAIVGIPILIAFVLFIINAGAYVTPQGGGVSSNPNSNATLCLPSDGKIAQLPYCESGDPTLSHCTSNENAYDIANSKGTTVYAATSGTVTYYMDTPDGKTNGGYGYYAIIVGNGYTTYYGHMVINSGLPVGGSKTVKAGDQIGLMDSTGNVTGSHVHFEMRAPAGNIADIFGSVVMGQQVKNLTNFPECLTK